MLRLVIPGAEMYDEVKEEFITIKDRHIQLEHSLVSLTKWESKWRKPFLTDVKKTQEETLDYIRCMTITQNVPDDTYRLLTADNYTTINDYIERPMTATTISQNGSKKNTIPEVVTSELIYYWMVALNIPFECQKWHLNRLLTLINVCNIKNQPEKKMSRSELIARNRELNRKRQNTLNTKG